MKAQRQPHTQEGAARRRSTAARSRSTKSQHEGAARRRSKKAQARALAPAHPDAMPRVSSCWGPSSSK
eukprot:CAMPEP_0172585808 /NCGR_PEP_ID=MMETSP1068-20121228/5193_1 /TAXON_ID=35684 /ORGANISM="Pseudopedinella elastica, Strain CCMP716" /LENGTH=67 /DNA_ID=CAMNT_0013380387 /DNA_START=135 /DNA_END=335 /DNA_ORIENTATION=-